jgi:NAD(P)-dependent dehydrogenase (short-subunit alcohol dehydrogenase family)
MGKLQGKVAVITGGTAGIGLAAHCPALAGSDITRIAGPQLTPSGATVKSAATARPLAASQGSAPLTVSDGGSDSRRSHHNGR